MFIKSSFCIHHRKQITHRLFDGWDTLPQHQRLLIDVYPNRQLSRLMSNKLAQINENILSGCSIFRMFRLFAVDPHPFIFIKIGKASQSLSFINFTNAF